MKFEISGIHPEAHERSYRFARNLRDAERIEREMRVEGWRNVRIFRADWA